MSSILTRRRIRAEVDCASYENFKDRFTGGTPKHWRGTTLSLELGLFLNLANAQPTDDKIVDLTASAFQSITVEVRAAAADTVNLMAKTVTSFVTPTAEHWLDLSAQHAVVNFSAAETNIVAGSHHIAISAVMVDGSKVTLGCSVFQIVEDGAGNDAGDPTINPGNALSLAEADARYFVTGGTIAGVACAPHYDLATITVYSGANGLTSLLLANVAPGALFSFVHATDGQKTYRVQAGTDAQAIPGIVRPADYNASTNAKILVSV